jgi:quinol monooxygenase YgiN
LSHGMHLPTDQRSEPVSVVVIATILPKPEHREDVIAAFLDVIPSVHQEPGCELYALNEGKDRLVMIEQWESREALAVHGKAQALTRLGPALDGKLTAQPDVRIYSPHPAGVGELGALR